MSIFDISRNVSNKIPYPTLQDNSIQQKHENNYRLDSTQLRNSQSKIMSPLYDIWQEVSSSSNENPQLSNALSKSLESKSASKNINNSIGLFSQHLKQKLEQTNSTEKTTEALHQEIKSMRELLLFFNKLINNKINKYQLHQFAPKGMSPSNHPLKQSQLLQSQIQQNEKIMQALQKQIRDIKQRDKLLQQKDYLIQLEQAADDVMARIKQRRKQKHNGKVVVQKLDGKLIEMKEALVEDQFKMVKIFKHNTLYFYKKIKENEKILEQLDRDYKQLEQNDKKVTEELNKCATLAKQKKMLVKTNPIYLGMMKTRDQLQKIAQQLRKKLEVTKRSKETEYLKITLEVDKIKRQLLSADAKLQEYKIRDNQVTASTENVIEKNKVAGKMLNKISQRYVEAIGLRMTRNTVKETAQHQQDQIPTGTREQKSMKKSLESSQFRTLSLKPSMKTSRFKKEHEANSHTIQFENSERKQYRVKPSLHLKKRSEGLNKFLNSHQEITGQIKTNKSQVKNSQN